MASLSMDNPIRLLSWFGWDQGSKRYVVLDISSSVSFVVIVLCFVVVSLVVVFSFFSIIVRLVVVLFVLFFRPCYKV